LDILQSGGNRLAFGNGVTRMLLHVNEFIWLLSQFSEAWKSLCEFEAGLD
jgi:hypothetical protein